MSPKIVFVLAGCLVWGSTAHAGPGHPESLLRPNTPASNQPKVPAVVDKPSQLLQPEMEQAIAPEEISVPTPARFQPPYPKTEQSVASSAEASMRAQGASQAQLQTSVSGAGGQPEGELSSLANQMRRFSQLDTNADGKLDLPEFSKFESDSE